MQFITSAQDVIYHNCLKCDLS